VSRPVGKRADGPGRVEPGAGALCLTPDNPTAGCRLLGTGVGWPLLAPGADIRHGRSHADRDA
jgi:hypothetical protein